ncbi:MAG: nuclear transport factor 2 family protein, partial [Gammaproteobacteria bacterium]|nr:nuclear transport factor 2 family protein [Gammaproteobacteria bacterium]
ETLASVWIERWNENKPDLIPLAEDFVHTSPFGRIEGREVYLETVKPMAKRNVTYLKVLRTLAGPDEAVIHFEMHTPKGLIHVSDWVAVKDGRITAVHSFYDATRLRY